MHCWYTHPSCMFPFHSYERHRLNTRGKTRWQSALTTTTKINRGKAGSSSCFCCKSLWGIHKAQKVLGCGGWRVQRPKLLHLHIWKHQLSESSKYPGLSWLRQMHRQTCATSLTKSEDANNAYTLNWETIIKQLFPRVSFEKSKQKCHSNSKTSHRH